MSIGSHEPDNLQHLMNTPALCSSCCILLAWFGGQSGLAARGTDRVGRRDTPAAEADDSDDGLARPARAKRQGHAGQHVEVADHRVAPHPS